MSDNLISIDQLAVALSGRHDRDDAFEDSVEEYIEFAKLLGARQRYDEIGSTYNDLRPLLEVCESSAERLFLSALVGPDLSYRPHVQKDNPPSLLGVLSGYMQNVNTGKPNRPYVALKAVSRHDV